jgi:iron complex transport system substrate-binding protein
MPTSGAGLDPELILAQDLCRVCALPAGHVDDALGYLGCTAEVVSLDPRSLGDVLETILAVGEHAGAPQRAEELVAALRRRLSAVADRVSGRARPAVAVIEWTDPPFTAGHWVPDLVTAAGGRPVAARPELIVVAPCGFGLDDAAAQAGMGMVKICGPARRGIDSGIRSWASWFRNSQGHLVR